MMRNSLLITTLIMAFLSCLSFFFAWKKGKHIQGLLLAKDMTLKIIPLLIFAFILAGMIQVLIPKELIIKWIGRESGLKGIFLGTVIGALVPGGPYTILPLSAGLLKVGISVPVLISFLSSWALLGVSKIPLQVAFLGPKIALIRFLSFLVFPPLAGLLASMIMKVLK